MAKKNIGATLSLKDGNFFANVKSAISASNNLKNTLSGTTTGVKKFGTQSAAAGGIITSLASKAAAAIGAFVGIKQAVNFGKDVVNTGLEFEQGMTNVSAISGATGSELEALREKAKEMGATTKFSALEASDAMSYMAMAGWNSSQMIDGISGIMNLAAASGEELASVSDIVTDSLTAFGLKASDSADFADILATACAKSNTNVAMLGEAFKNVAPTAGAMGYNVRDTTVALGLMANAGIKGGAAGTSLNGVLTRLAKPTKEVNAAMSALGLSAVNADGSMKPLSQFIPELQAKFSTLTAAQKGQYATMIAGKNAMSGFLSIVNSSPSDFQALTDAINNSEGAAQSMADTMNDTVSGKLTLLKSQFEGVKIAIYDALGSSQFKGVLQSMSDGLSAITPYVTTLTVAVGNGLFSAINTIYGISMTVFNAVKTAVENNGPAIEGLRSAFDNVRNSIINTFGGDGTSLIQTLANVILPTLCNSLSLVMNIASGVISAASTLSPVIAGVAGAVTAYKIAVTAANVVEGIRNGLIAFSAVMTGTQAAAFAPLTTATIAQIAATQALNVVTGTFGAIMSFVTSPIGLVVIAIGAVIAIGVVLYKHWDTVKAKALELWNGMKNVFENIKNVVSEKFNAVKNVMSNVMDGAKNIVSQKLNNIKNAYSEHGGGIKGIAAGCMTALKEDYTIGYDAINALTGGKLGQVVDSIKNKFAPMVGAVKEKLTGIKDAFGGAFSNAVNFIKTSYNEGALKPIVDKIVSAFNNVKTAVAEKFNGIKEAVSSKLTAAGEAVSGVTDKIAGKFTDVKDKIAEKFTGIKDSVVSILSPLESAVGSVATGIKTVISTIIDGIKSYIINTVQNIKATVMNIVNGEKQNFITFFTSIKTAFENVKNGIAVVFEGIKTVISGAFQFIVGIFTLNINTVKNGVKTIKDGFFTEFEGIKQIVINVWSVITSAASLSWSNTKTVVSGAINGIKAQISTITGTVSGVFNSVQSTILNTFESVKSKVVSVFENVKSTISNAISTIKGYFNFSWSLPKIKLPHFKISGSFSINPPSVPSFGVEWYKNGGIMMHPTMFGMNGSNAMIGGEAGAEAVVPLDMLWSKLAQIMNSQNASTKSTVNNYINVTVNADNANTDEIADTVAKKIVESIENM